MNIQQASKIRQNTCLIDILQRKFWVKNYYLQYDAGQLVNVYLDIEDQFASRSTAVSYKFLYYCEDEFSDAEKCFADYILSLPDKHKYTSMNHEDLYNCQQIYSAGFNSGFNMRKKI